MKLKELTLVSSNKEKAREVERILEIPIDIASIDIDEIQSMNLRKITLHKVRQAYQKIKKPVLVDDVSFEVKAWNGFPGPLIKWLLEEKNDPNLMLKMLGNEKNRRAIARLGVGFHDGKKAYFFGGEVKGKIGFKIGGDNGFGWDRVFIPDGFTQTFSEMDPEIKDTMSHRGRALKKLKDFFKANYDI